MNTLWTIYDEIIEDYEREIRQLDVLIIIEKWKDINEKVRKENINKLTKRKNTLKRQIDRNIILRKQSI
jgi:hypothetical protein